jgi:anti-anti-sigma regulatory factor
MMQSNFTSLSSPTRLGGGEDALAEALPVDAARRQPGRSQIAQLPAARTLSGGQVWRHRLVLTGRLDRGSAVELEDEIDCLCEEGVAVLTLDLHELDAIDSVGARAVASRGAGCRRQGLAFTVIPGVPGVRRALVEAGAEGLMVEGSDGGGAVVRPPSDPADGSHGGTFTVMTKSL